MASGKTDYLRKKPGSNNWYIRFQYPPALRQTACDIYGEEDWPREREWSLGTSDELTARRLAQPAIQKHLDLLAIHDLHTSPDPAGSIREVYEVEPGTHKSFPDGGRLIATDKEIINFDANNVMTTRPNPRRFEVVPLDSFNSPAVARAAKADAEAKKAGIRDIDKEAIETYIADRRRRGKFEEDDDPNAIRRTLDELKLITENRTISQSTKKDVENLIHFLMNDRDPQLSHGRTKKLMSYMRAAVNYDLKNNREHPNYKYNVFENFFVPNEELDNQHPPYSETDLAAIKANLHRFTDEQKLMLVWHISSSIRPIGIYSICADGWEDGENSDTGETYKTRYVRITKDKGKYGPRALPIPQAVLDLKKADGTPLLPPVIDVPLFTTPLAMLLVQINNKLETLKIHTNENRKTLYSGRHRARDRLLNRDATDKMSKAIMGHSRKIEQHDKYGTGFAMWKMKVWIDKIGF